MLYLWWLCMNVYMYVVSVDVPLWHLICCNVCTFAWYCYVRWNRRNGGVYALYVGGIQGSVVCASVCLMSSSSFLLGTLLPLNVYICTSKDIPLSELPQRLPYTILHRRMSASCGKACPLVAVETRLMVRPWTYVCRRIEEVVYLEGKRKRT